MSGRTNGPISSACRRSSGRSRAPSPCSSIRFLHNDYGPYIVVAVQEVGQGAGPWRKRPTATIETGRDFEHLWGEPIDPSQPKSPSNCDTRYYRQYWINAVRWLAARRLALKNVSFAITTSKRRVNPDEPLTVHVTWKPPVVANGAATEPPLRHPGRGFRSRHEHRPAGARRDAASRHARLRIPGSAAGFRLLPFRRQSDSLAGAVCAPAIITCDTADPELVDTRSDPKLMAQIAQVSSGRVLTADSTDARQPGVDADRAIATHIDFQQTAAWDRGWILTLLAAVLITEWLLRRRWSLI